MSASGKPVLAFARSVLAVAGGYAALVLLTYLVQESLLGGVSFRDSPLHTLLIAGILTPCAGGVAGYAAALVAGRWPVLHVVPICAAVAVETTALYATGRVDGPLWFEALAGAALIAGILAGAGYRRWHSSARAGGSA